MIAMKKFSLSICTVLFLINSVNLIIINCEYKDLDYGFGLMYTCVDENFEINEGNFESSILTGIAGRISPQKSLKDVKQIAIENSEVLRFPSSLGSYFPNLESLVITNSKMKFVNKVAFTSLNELKFLKLSGNEISLIEPELFEDNYNLEEIYLNDNKIEKISTDILSLGKLKLLQLENNLCVNFIYQQSDTIEERQEKKDDILKNCVLSSEDEKIALKSQLKNAVHQMSEMRKIIEEKDQKLDEFKNSKIINGSENYQIENEALIQDNLRLRSNEIVNKKKLQENEEKILEISRSLQKQLELNDKLTEEFDTLKIQYFNMSTNLNASLTQTMEKYDDVTLKFDNLEKKYKQVFNAKKLLENINKKLNYDFTLLGASNAYLENLLFKNKIRVK